MENLNVSKAATHTSERTANDRLKSLASAIRRQLDIQLLKSPYISVLCDESTDISVTKTLVVYTCILGPDSFTASTHFVGNMKVHNGTATVITQALKELLQEKQVGTPSVMALGSDGATVMTSGKGGVTGLLKHVNPMLTNYHCMAHRLALVTFQASQNMPYLVKYQEILTGLLYYFKNSSVCTESLKAIQQVLEEPQLKLREVQEVRWRAIYSEWPVSFAPWTRSNILSQ